MAKARGRKIDKTWYNERDLVTEMRAALAGMLDAIPIPGRNTNKLYAPYWIGRRALDDFEAQKKEKGVM